MITPSLGRISLLLITQERINLFGDISDGAMLRNAPGKIINLCWQRLPDCFPIRQDEGVIMPNHIHGIIWILDHGTGEASAPGSYHDLYSSPADASPQRQAIGTRPGSLGAIIQNFKSVSTRRIHQWYQSQGKGEAFTRINSGTLKYRGVNASPRQIWHRNYYEHIIRNQKELDAIREYIHDNPRRWTEDKEYRK